MCRKQVSYKSAGNVPTKFYHGVTFIYFHAPLAICRTKVQEHFLQNSIHRVTSLHFHAPLVVCRNIAVQKSQKKGVHLAPFFWYIISFGTCSIHMYVYMYVYMYMQRREITQMDGNSVAHFFMDSWSFCSSYNLEWMSYKSSLLRPLSSEKRFSAF